MKTQKNPENPPPHLTCVETWGPRWKASRRTTGLLACVASLVLACHSTAAVITIVYDFESLSAGSGGSVQLNGQDNWTANSNIVVDTDGSNKYAVGWANSVPIQDGNRPNDVNFAMAMPTEITEFSLMADIRVGTFEQGGEQRNRRSMFGLTVGSGSFLFGAGGTDTEENKWLVHAADGTKNFSSAVTTNESNLFWSMQLDVDLLANGGNGAASLSVDSGSGFVAISDLQNINLQLLSLTGYSDGSSFDGMGISLGQFGRLDNLTMSYIPEPSAALLGGLGLLVALFRRRR